LSRKTTFKIKESSAKSASRVVKPEDTKKDFKVTGLSTSKISADWEFQGNKNREFKGGKNFNKMFKRGGNIAAVPNV
jgi:hypothetical protein